LLREIILITSIISSSIIRIILLSLVRFITAAYSLYIFTSMSHGSALKITNPLLSTKPKDYTLLLIHLIPVIFIIIKPEVITNWY
jgi:NADH:ubiquinone oxidoreductase subunit 4 (subunit M)